MSGIEIVNLSKYFGKKEVLKNISLTLNKGEVTAILGPNGSGKSTLMKSILGLVNPDQGQIIINNQSIIRQWDYRKEIGYMPQIANYPDNISVKEIISMIRNIRQMDDNAMSLVSLFKLDNDLDKKIKQLSGGMRQKVNAIIALMFDSPILILDESTVGLDPVSRLLFKELILKEKMKGKTILLITHHMNEIEELADKIVFILEGRIFFHGSLDEVKSEQNENDFEKAVAKILESKQVFSSHV
ncbi:MAG: ABC transporter ATP-binding protein [Cytophagaceae bacterium]